MILVALAKSKYENMDARDNPSCCESERASFQRVYTFSNSQS